jgi:hypothetical protein
MKDAPIEEVKITVGGIELDLDPKNMVFDESTLSNFMEKEFGWIDYLGKKLEEANKECLLAEVEYEKIFAEKFVIAKDQGGTEKYSTFKAQCDPDVVAANKLFIEKKYNVGLLKAHLKAWDKNHENAQNRGHTLRKELDKLNKDIYLEGDKSFEDYVEEMKK